MDQGYSDERIPCRVCNRSFAPEVLARHQNICKNVTTKSNRRKAFDSSKQRATENVSVREIKQAQKKDVAPPKSHWREKHQDFINAVRSARGVQKALDSGGPLPPPPPPSLNPDYIQCPHCTRRFNQKAAERHISFCKDQQLKLPRTKASPVAQAKQNARLNYQAPKLKPKASPSTSSPGFGISGNRAPARGASTTTTSSRTTPAARPAARPAATSRTPAAAPRGRVGAPPGGRRF